MFPRVRREQVSKVASCFVSPVGVECFQPSSVLVFVSLCRRFESTISQSVLVSCRRLASSVLCRRLANVLNVGYCFVDLSRGLRVEDSTFRSCSVSPVGVECFERQFLFVGLSRGLSRGFHSRFLFRRRLASRSLHRRWISRFLPLAHHV